ncbi:hypothetical protein A3Q56_01514 [Intoshia linei]|uniref:Sec16 Sec23-binding domain-containing protein n=1 Tax=Intoshia linei TaxID=1819745 RepID=A0A177B907_9BILA|nr:hypothetical protein A3Q56_01514 [Intoshia linei]
MTNDEKELSLKELKDNIDNSQHKNPRKFKRHTRIDRSYYKKRSNDHNISTRTESEYDRGSFYSCQNKSMNLLDETFSPHRRYPSNSIFNEEDRQMLKDCMQLMKSAALKNSLSISNLATSTRGSILQINQPIYDNLETELPEPSISSSYIKTSSPLEISQIPESTKFVEPHAFITFHNGQLWSIDEMIEDTEETNFFVENELSKKTFISQLKYNEKMKEILKINDLSIYPGPFLGNNIKKNEIISFCRSEIAKIINKLKVKKLTLKCKFNLLDNVLMWKYLSNLISHDGNMDIEVFTDFLENWNQDSFLTECIQDDTVSENSCIDSLNPSLKSKIGGSQNSINVAPDCDKLFIDKFTKLLILGKYDEAIEFSNSNSQFGYAFLMSCVVTGSFVNDAIRKTVTNFYTQKFDYSSVIVTVISSIMGTFSGLSVEALMEYNWINHVIAILNCNFPCNGQFGVNQKNLDIQAVYKIRSQFIEIIGQQLLSLNRHCASQFCRLIAHGLDNAGSLIFQYDISKSQINQKITGHIASTCNLFIQATEICEYAYSLISNVYILPLLIPYKIVYAYRLLEAGMLKKVYFAAKALYLTSQRYHQLYTCPMLVENLHHILNLSTKVYRFASQSGFDMSWHFNLIRYVEQQNLTKIDFFSDSTLKIENINLDSTEIKHDTQPIIEEAEYDNISEIVTSSNHQNVCMKDENINGIEIETESNQNFQVMTKEIDIQNAFESDMEPPNEILAVKPVSLEDYNSSDLVEPSIEQKNLYNNSYQTNVPEFNDLSVKTNLPSTKIQENDQIDENRNNYPNTKNTSQQYSRFETNEMPDSIDNTDASALKSENPDLKSNIYQNSWFKTTLRKVIYKFAPKDKNEVILPDDNEKSLIYDPVKKRWIDKNADFEEEQDFKPPTIHELSQSDDKEKNFNKYSMSSTFSKEANQKSDSMSYFSSINKKPNYFKSLAALNNSNNIINYTQNSSQLTPIIPKFKFSGDLSKNSDSIFQETHMTHSATSPHIHEEI